MERNVTLWNTDVSEFNMSFDRVEVLDPRLDRSLGNFTLIMGSPCPSMVGAALISDDMLPSDSLKVTVYAAGAVKILH